MATFVICHGAWSAGWAWKKMRPLLRADGHDVITPTYTGLGERAHLVSRSIDLETHIQDVLDVLHYEDLTDIVLVGHSYGGMVATGVADRARSRLSQLVYLDAFVPRHGECLDDLLPPAALAQRNAMTGDKSDGWLLPPNPPPPDTPAEDLAWITPLRRWQPAKTFAQPLLLRHGETDLPRTYIYCTRMGPGDVFRPFAERAKSEAGWRYCEIDASHSPNVTAPRALADLLGLIAREKGSSPIN